MKQRNFFVGITLLMLASVVNADDCVDRCYEAESKARDYCSTLSETPPDTPSVLGNYSPQYQCKLDAEDTRRECTNACSN